MRPSPSLVFALLFATGLNLSAEHHEVTLPDPTDGKTLAKQGFTSLFDGSSLKGWEKVGGTGQFAVKDGTINGFGEKIKGNTFLRTKKTFRDFVLVFEVKMLDPTGNSGCQFRSNQREKDGRVFGYQCEHDNEKKGTRAFTAGVYDEARRGWLFPAKDASGKEKKAFTEQGIRLFKWDDWNTIVIHCEGDHIRTWLNGEKRSDFRDTDEKHFTPEGFIALQVHSGKSADIMWRNLYLKELK